MREGGDSQEFLKWDPAVGGHGKQGVVKVYVLQLPDTKLRQTIAVNRWKVGKVYVIRLCGTLHFAGRALPILHEHSTVCCLTNHTYHAGCMVFLFRHFHPLQLKNGPDSASESAKR